MSALCGIAPRIILLLVAISVPCAAPLHAETWAYEAPDCPAERDPGAAASPASNDGSPPTAGWLACYAPAFLVEEAERPYNRIGKPELHPGWLFGVRARVDPDTPAVFVERREDRVAGRRVWQLVYRVHFEKIPLRFSRYFFEAHRNPGLMVVLTADVATGQILFVSTVHTCGCYFVVIPTDAVDPGWLPADWPEDDQHLYGQRLPVRLSARDVARGLVISVESQSHRVKEVRAGADPRAERRAELPLVPMAQLLSLPVEGRPGRTGSFFYGAGPLRGHVRGAWNPLEGLTVFGLVSLDPTVGMDKRFGDPEVTGTPFYTQLPFWMHQRSRLDRFDRLLRAFGFRLPETSE